MWKHAAGPPLPEVAGTADGEDRAAEGPSIYDVNGPGDG
jgi:hypothetical protein